MTESLIGVVNAGSSTLKLRVVGSDDTVEVAQVVDPWSGDEATATAAIGAAATTTAAATAAITTAAAAATTAAAEAARTLFTGAGLVDHDRAAFKGLTVHAIDCGLRFGIGAHFDKAKTFGATGVAIHHDLGRRDGAKLRKRDLQRFVTDAVGQIAHVEFVSHEREPFQSHNTSGASTRREPFQEGAASIPKPKNYPRTLDNAYKTFPGCCFSQVETPPERAGSVGT